jgi:predicted pyridoxine 5'-phosphate oxidase superfamily flavin-nucleotide-binding protein
MSRHYGEIAFTEQVRNVQERYGSRRFYDRHTGRASGVPGPDPLTPDVTDYLADRDSFYLATVGETGWPYVQFRGGPRGFLRVIDDHTIGWADFRGNLQHVTTGNLTGHDRVALIVMDYPARQRLKVFGRARVVFADEDAALLDSLRHPDYDAVVERAMVVSVDAFDWNCHRHITPRYTVEELEPLIIGFRQRIEALETENAELVARLIAVP